MVALQGGILLRAARLAAVVIVLTAVPACSGKQAPTPPHLPSSKQTSTATTSGVFRDVAKTSGIDFHHDPGLSGSFRFVETTPGGCAFLDYDGDGKLDIFLVQSGPAPGGPIKPRPSCKLYHNEGTPGNPRFRDVSEKAGLEHDFGYVQGVAVADYDNDGFPDLYLTGYGGNHLLHNDGKGHFVDVTATAGVGDSDKGPRWATSAAWADYDGDGLLDLYVCHYCIWSLKSDLQCANRLGQRTYCTPSQYDPDCGRLYRNLGQGRFKDVTHEAGIDKLKGRGLGAVWLDYDDDGRPDLYVANDLNPNFLFHNLGGGRFQEVGLETGASNGSGGEALSGMGIAAADYDGDGREDLFVTNFSGQAVSLFRSIGKDQFRHSTQAAGLAASTYSLLGWGAAFLDFDNDGWPDIVVGNGHVNPDIDQTSIGVTYREPKGLYRNLGNGSFEDAAALRGDMSRPGTTRGLSAGDFDNDGLVDVLANNLGGAAELFHNEDSRHGHFLTLRLEGTKSNRDGIGAKVTLTAGGHSWTAYCRRSSSYCSSNDPRLHFGLGTVEKVERIEIHWPSGRSDSFSSLNGVVIPTDAFLLAVEGKPLGHESPN